MDRRKVQEVKRTEANKKIQQLLLDCRDLLNSVNYDYNCSLDNKHFRTLLLHNSENRTSLLVWALNELGVQITTVNEKVLFESLNGLGLLNSKEVDFVKGTMMNPMLQLQKWVLLLQSVHTMQNQSSTPVEDGGKSFEKNYEIMVLKQIKLPSINPAVKKLKASETDINEVTENDVKNVKDEIEQIKSQLEKQESVTESIEANNDTLKDIKNYFELRADLDCYLKRYLSIDSAENVGARLEPENRSIVKPDILSDVVKGTNAILNDIQSCKDIQETFNAQN